MGMSEGAFIGLDIGGQSIKGIRLERSGRITRRAAQVTPAGAGREAVLDVVRSVLADLVEEGPAAAVGIGTPGGVDKDGNIVGEAANIPGWPGTALGAEASKSANAPAFVRNDGNLAAYAEWAVRAGDPAEASRAFLFVGLGTGIGGGYVEDGELLSGVNDKALEIGHVIVYPNGRKCACGRQGCVEAYASGPSIGRVAMDLAQGHDSPLARSARAGAKLNAREVYDALAEGDELAIAAHQVAAEALSRAIGAALAFLAPDTVVLGGGVLAGAKSLVSDVAAMSPNFVYEAASEGVRFREALLGPGAGLLGAALYGASRVLGREELLDLAAKARADSAR
jgi:Transcriptional regulator/sugar kinase